MFDGRVLSRQAERVPTHGMQHVEAAHLGVAGDDVADRVIAHMPHVDVARRVREHLEHVLLGLGMIFRDLVQVGIFPSLLPTRFDLVRVVLFHRPSSLADAVIHIGFIVAASRFHEGKKRQHPRRGKPDEAPEGYRLAFPAGIAGSAPENDKPPRRPEPACGARPRFTPDRANRSGTACLSGLHALRYPPSPIRRCPG